MKGALTLLYEYCSQEFDFGNLTLKQEGGQAWCSLEQENNTLPSNACSSITGRAAIIVFE